MTAGPLRGSTNSRLFQERCNESFRNHLAAEAVQLGHSEEPDGRWQSTPFTGRMAPESEEAKLRRLQQLLDDRQATIERLREAEEDGTITESEREYLAECEQAVERLTGETRTALIESLF